MVSAAVRWWLRYKEMSKCKALFAESFRLSRHWNSPWPSAGERKYFWKVFKLRLSSDRRDCYPTAAVIPRSSCASGFIKLSSYDCNQVIHTGLVISAIHHLEGWQWTSQSMHFGFNLWLVCLFVLLTEIRGIWNDPANSTRSPTKVAFHW